MKKCCTLIFNLVLFCANGQSNLIPNGNFESGSYSSTVCSANGKQLNDVINNWKVTTKGANYSDPITKWIKLDECGYNASIVPLLCITSIGNYYNVAPSNKVILLSWTHEGQVQGNCIKIGKDDIGVSLENNNKFINNKKYIIRYKVLPKVSQDVTIGNCSSNKIESHLRIFLSKNGPLNWKKNNNILQELTMAGFNKVNIYPNNNFTPCDWIIVEKIFVPAGNEYSALILFMEKGAVYIDDVEVFEECESNYMVQNKTYYSGSYPANPPYVTGGTFKEQSGFNLTAGSSIGKPNTPNGQCCY